MGLIWNVAPIKKKQQFCSCIGTYREGLGNMKSLTNTDINSNHVYNICTLLGSSQIDNIIKFGRLPLILYLKVGTLKIQNCEILHYRLIRGTWDGYPK